MEIIILIAACVFFYFRSTKHLVSVLRTGLEEESRHFNSAQPLILSVKTFYRLKSKGWSAEQIYDKLRAISRPTDNWIHGLTCFSQGTEENKVISDKEMRHGFASYIYSKELLLKSVHGIAT